MNFINLLEWVSFITGIALIKKSKETFLFILLLILGYSAINEIAAYSYSSYYQKTNIVFYITYAVISCMLFFAALKKITKGNKARATINITAYLLAVSFLLEIIIKTGFSKYPFNSMAAGCFFIILFCFNCLAGILNDDNIDDIKYESKFWFLTAALFFHLLLLTYIFIHNYVLSREIQVFNKYLITTANLIFYPFSIISFLCQLKKKK